MLKILRKIFRILYIDLYYFYNYFFNLFTIKINEVQIGKRWKIYGKISIRNDGKIIIGENFKAFCGRYYNPVAMSNELRISCARDGSIKMGNYIGLTNCSIYCQNSICIEDNVMIGAGCKIWDTNFHSLNPLIRGTLIESKKNVMTSPIHIRRYAFIGAGTIILKGTTIGENSIITAGSVVYKNIPDNQIWGGNPAVFLGVNPWRLKDSENH